MEELKLIQGITGLGSFGLLVVITYFFLKYIPSHFAQLAKERADQQQAMILQAGEGRKTIEYLTNSFTIVIKEEREDCDRRYKELKQDDQQRYEKLESDYKELDNKLSTFETNIREIKHEVNNIAHDRAMKKQVEDAQNRRTKQSEKGS